MSFATSVPPLPDPSAVAMPSTEQGPLIEGMPVHVVVNCSDGTYIMTNPTQEELDAKIAADALTIEAAEKKAAERAAALAIVQASEDPTIKALALALGLSGS